MTRNSKWPMPKIPASSVETGAILAIAPWVFAARMCGLSLASPLDAVLDLQRFAAEKSVAAFNAGVDACLEATRHLMQGGTIGSLSHLDNLDRMAAAALKPVSRQVKANARKRKR